MNDTGTNGTPTPAGGGFDLNHSTIISLCYLASFITGISGLVGIVLAYVWRKDAAAPWEASHYAYQIRTFWIGFIGSIIGGVLMIVLVGFLILLAVAVLVVVRSVLALLAAQKHEPMPNPDSWTI